MSQGAKLYCPLALSAQAQNRSVLTTFAPAWTAACSFIRSSVKCIAIPSESSVGISRSGRDGTLGSRQRNGFGVADQEDLIDADRARFRALDGFATPVDEFNRSDADGYPVDRSVQDPGIRPAPILAGRLQGDRCPGPPTRIGGFNGTRRVILQRLAGLIAHAKEQEHAGFLFHSQGYDRALCVKPWSKISRCAETYSPPALRSYCKRPQLLPSTETTRNDPVAPGNSAPFQNVHRWEDAASLKSSSTNDCHRTPRRGCHNECKAEQTARLSNIVLNGDISFAQSQPSNA